MNFLQISSHDFKLASLISSSVVGGFFSSFFFEPDASGFLAAY